ncbi:MAG TPA: class I SAM-dependent methyltransferase [Usitatibacter sp.]|nr:class I SAM-dependent methyltransferase [Usitatibacter sp.]
MPDPAAAYESPFSLDPGLLSEILRHAKPLGHHEEASTLNIGFGFLYYALARALRPRHVVVVGSGYGFSVVCLALGLKDNGAGKLSFVDPSYSVLRNGPLNTIGGTSQWDDPERVRAHFGRFGVAGIVTHFKMTSADFFAGYAARELPDIDIAFIDGNHSYEDVRHDFLASLAFMRRNACFLLHDTNIYVREFLGHAGVKRWLKVLEREAGRFQMVDFPLSSGVALVRVVDEGPWQPAD